jgi:hypothetical protein
LPFQQVLAETGRLGGGQPVKLTYHSLLNLKQFPLEESELFDATVL